MAKIQPFNGILYNSQIYNGDLSEVIAPPYDVIDAAHRQRLLEKHPDNIIRIILGLESALERTPEVYEQSAETCRQWQSEKKLIEEEQAGFYIWDQIYTIENQTFTRRALAAKIRALPYSAGEVIPHENTHAKAKADRLDLFKACGVQFSQIFSLYRDEDRTISQIIEMHVREPLLTAVDENGVENKLYNISDEDSIQALQSAFEDKPVYIADGHHRYETSVNYFQELRVEGFTLMTLVALEDPGLNVLPYHRVVRMEQKATDVLQKLTTFGSVEIFPIEDWEKIYEKLQTIKGGNALGFANKGLGQCGIITFGEVSFSDSWPGSKIWRSLDVSVLHAGLLADVFGWSKEEAYSKEKIYFSHNRHDCMNQLTDEYDWFIFLRPLDLSAMLALADEGEKMPPKSTFFYPKFLSGFINATLH